MNFCPICSNILLIYKESDGFLLRCRTCVYYFPLFKQIKATKNINSKKQAEIVVPQSELPVSEIQCVKCNNNKAEYEEKQIRGLDEPSTIFYTCTNPECKFKWTLDR